jgi:hypothetical protein
MRDKSEYKAGKKSEEDETNNEKDNAKKGRRDKNGETRERGATRTD